MRNELNLPIGSLFAFLLVLTRVSGIFIFVPIPGAKGLADPARIMLSLGITIALFPIWPQMPVSNPDVARLFAWLAMEAGLGLAAGLLVSYATESLQFGAQMVSLQAGLSFASTIDPMTQADSTVLMTIAQLLSGSLFFAFGLDRLVIHAFVQSLTAYPPAAFDLTPQFAGKILPFGTAIFSTGFMIVLPVVAFLLMVDIALATLSRLNAQLQLLTLAFPFKLLSTAALLAWLMMLYPRVFEHMSGRIAASLGAIAHR